MASFSKESLQRLEECHPDLQKLLLYAIKFWDFKIIQAYRSPEEQLDKFNQGFSKVKRGKHNIKPSLAVDIYPFPIYKNLNDEKYRRRFYFQAGHILQCARELNIRVRWGGDWNMNLNFEDQSFQDLPHFELI